MSVHSSNRFPCGREVASFGPRQLFGIYLFALTQISCINKSKKMSEFSEQNSFRAAPPGVLHECGRQLTKTGNLSVVRMLRCEQKDALRYRKSRS